MVTPSLLADPQTGAEDMEWFRSPKRGPIHWVDVGRMGRRNQSKLDIKLVRQRQREGLLAGTLQRRSPRIGESMTCLPDTGSDWTEHRETRFAVLVGD